jgi:hypothetical protein
MSTRGSLPLGVRDVADCDQDTALSRLNGSNVTYIGSELPHPASLVVANVVRFRGENLLAEGR